MKIAVVGSINRDMNIISTKIPLKGETIKGEGFSYAPGGKGANQAVAMARLGAEVHFFGALGQDDHGRAMMENFDQEGINRDHLLVSPEENTGLAIITLAEKDNTIVIIPGANGLVDQAYLDGIKEQLKDMDALVLQNEIPEESTFHLIRWAKEEGLLTLLNPAPALELPEDIIEAVDFLTPNEHEAKVIFASENYEEIVKKYPNKCIITLGKEGALFAEDERTVLRIESVETEVVDTTGAGDTFNGAFIVQYLKSKSIKESIHFANMAAGLAIQAMGAQTGMPKLAEVEKKLTLRR